MTGDFRPDAADVSDKGRTDEMLQHYSRALDEIYRLRTLLAVEASILACHLDYKTFPKSRRAFAEEQVERMRSAACGGSELALVDHPTLRQRQSRREAGMPDTLTRWAWERALDDELALRLGRTWAAIKAKRRDLRADGTLPKGRKTTP